MSGWNQVRELWDRGFNDEEIAETLGVHIEDISDLIDQWVQEKEEGQFADWEDEGYGGRKDAPHA